MTRETEMRSDHTGQDRQQESTPTVTDPVCGMRITPQAAAERHVMDGEWYYFCSAGCAAVFCANPNRYRASAARGRPRGDENR